ncbi:MAG: protease modulator HflK [Limisphaerales bacterium]
MEQNFQRKGLVNLLLLLVLGTAAALVARHAYSVTGLISTVFMGLGFLVAAVSYFQMRLEDRERLEQLETDEMKRAPASGTLFEASIEEDHFPARRARIQFERFFVPGFAIVLLLVQATAAGLLWHASVEDPASTVEQATVAMALFGIFALVFFQFGKYSAALARHENQALLRPGASYLLLGAVLSLIAAAVEVAGWAGYPGIDKIVARVLVVFLGLVAIENLLGLVFELYRPRVKGQAAKPLYESRLIGLLGQPGGLITTAAQALDYQFGFKVSETWFYRFLEQALAWLILLQLAVLMLSTSVVFIGPGEQALLERFGRPVEGREVLAPGGHFKWPWPIDRVYRYETELIQNFKLGLVTDHTHDEQPVMLWTKPHAKEEYNLLVASRTTEPESADGEKPVPVNLLAVDIPVQYQIKNLREFAYNHANAGELLEQLANGEVTRYLVNVDIEDIMAAGRQKAAADLRERIQARADLHQLGVRIVFVGLHGIHPPVKVAADFERVIGAIQDRETTNLYARAYRAERVPMAHAEATELTNRAEAYRFRTTTAAIAAASRFTNQMTAHQASPEVYRLRTYLDTVGRSVATARKYVIVPTNTHDVVTLNLEETVRGDILNELRLPASTNR